MKKYYKPILIAILVSMNSCGFNTNYVYMIDRHPNPGGPPNHLKLNRWRGGYGMVSYGSGNAAKESIEYDKKQFNKENGSKKWIVLNWGKPDSIENHGALIYYIYSRKSKDAPDYYRLQSDFKAGPVKLGFKGNRLVEIQAYWPDRAYKGQKVVILNP